MTESSIDHHDTTRLNSEIERLENDIQRIANKLNNDGFIARVPAAMIENEQKKMAKFEREKSALETQMRQISNA